MTGWGSIPFTMKRLAFLAVLAMLLFSAPAMAQRGMKKGLATINRATAEAHVRFLADDELLGRYMGSPGGRVASNYIVAQLRQLGVAPLLESYFQPFEAYFFKSRKKLYPQGHPDIPSVYLVSDVITFRMRNVLGVIPGRRADEYVIIGAHYDHLGYNTRLESDSVYNGADDNASGVSAVLQLARAFAASGVRPERTVVFAFWDGEECGTFGSRHYLETRDTTKVLAAYMNYDMIGRNKYPDRPRHVVCFYPEAHPAFGGWLRSDIEKYGLRLEPEYKSYDKPIGGSDNAPFGERGIPVIWYHTDGHPDFHQPGDEADRINWDKLVEITRASFMAAWRLANEKGY